MCVGATTSKAPPAPLAPGGQWAKKGRPDPSVPLVLWAPPGPLAPSGPPAKLAPSDPLDRKARKVLLDPKEKSAPPAFKGLLVLSDPLDRKERKALAEVLAQLGQRAKLGRPALPAPSAQSVLRARLAL